LIGIAPIEPASAGIKSNDFVAHLLKLFSYLAMQDACINLLCIPVIGTLVGDYIPRYPILNEDAIETTVCG
jgi:hypothetical protein